MKIIEDKELYLDDRTDLLKTKKYANVLKEAILNIHTPSTIGLFGEWGSGKSSIIKTVQNDLEKENPNIKFITYDAWKYTQDSFRRTFLVQIVNQLHKCEMIDKSIVDEATKNLYETESQDIEVTSKVNWGFIACVFLAIVFVCYVITFLGWPEKYEMTTQIIVAAIGVTISLVKNMLIDYKTSITQPLLFSPEQFEERFDNLVKAFLKNKKEKGKLVIIIDNLDRCSKESAYQLLGDIKGFLEKDGVVFVVPIDDQALLNYLENYNCANKGEAREFLRKIFNVVIRIKEYRTRDLHSFTENLLEQKKIRFDPNTISIITQEFASNPRRIVQFINNFQVEKILILNKRQNGEETVTQHEALIAFLLILREEWGDFYRKIAKDSSVLLDRNPEKDKKNQEVEDNDLQIFLNYAMGVWENADPKVIASIIDNLDNDLMISEELRSEIDQGKLPANIGKENFKEIIKYLINELNEEIKHKTFETRALLLFRVLLRLFDSNKLDFVEEKERKDIFDRLYLVLKEEHFELTKKFNKDECRVFFNFVKQQKKCGSSFLLDECQEKMKKVCNILITRGEERQSWVNRLVVFFDEIKVNNWKDYDLSFYDFAIQHDIRIYLNLKEIKTSEKTINTLLTDRVKDELLKTAIQEMDDPRLEILMGLAHAKKLDSDDSFKYSFRIIDIIVNFRGKKRIEKTKKILILLKNVNVGSDKYDFAPSESFKNFISNYFHSIQEEELKICSNLVCKMMKVYKKEELINILDDLIPYRSNTNTNFKKFVEEENRHNLQAELFLRIWKQITKSKNDQNLLLDVLKAVNQERRELIFDKICDLIPKRFFDNKLLSFISSYGTKLHQKKIKEIIEYRGI